MAENLTDLLMEDDNVRRYFTMNTTASTPNASCAITSR